MVNLNDEGLKLSTVELHQKMASKRKWIGTQWLWIGNWLQTDLPWVALRPGKVFCHPPGSFCEYLNKTCAMF